jgi:hypothetical protein
MIADVQLKCRAARRACAWFDHDHQGDQGCHHQPCPTTTARASIRASIIWPNRVATGCIPRFCPIERPATTTRPDTNRLSGEAFDLSVADPLNGVWCRGENSLQGKRLGIILLVDVVAA